MSRWNQKAWAKWYASGSPDDQTRPDRKSKPLLPGETNDQLFEQSVEVVIPRHLLPAGFSLNEKPRPKSSDVDKLLKAHGIRP